MNEMQQHRQIQGKWQHRVDSEPESASTDQYFDPEAI
jgi:hypothetical protein